jgi:endo-1,4-beta-xylanase
VNWQGTIGTNAGGWYNTSLGELLADTWYHLAGTYDGEEIKAYKDGVLISTNDAPSGPPNSESNSLKLARHAANAGQYFTGTIDEVRIYDRALSAEEILFLNQLEPDEVPVPEPPAEVVVDMEIPFATPVIDGEVDDIWANASAQSLVSMGDPIDAANASVIWKALYDSVNLYVMVDVTDDSLNNDSASTWQDDGVEIYFDGGNTKLTTALSGDDHQYSLGWTTEEIQGTNIDGYTDGIEHAQVDTDTGWRIEVKLPWLTIQGAEPQAGDLIGIDVYYNDDDDGGDSRENKLLGFSAPIEGWNDASQWGTAILLEE